MKLLETPGSEQSFHPSAPTLLEANDDRFRLELNVLGLDKLFQKEERAPRSAREQHEMYDTIALVARVFSKTYDLKVLPSSTGGWCCTLDPKGNEAAGRFMNGEIKTLTDLPADIFKPKAIYYDREDLEKRPRDELMGLIRHEVGHANHSDFRLLLEGQKRAKDEGYLPTSWLSIMNPLEDPWVNNKEIAGSEVVREKMTALYSADVPEIEARINEQPLTRQLALNIIHYWATGQSVSTLKDKRVLELFQKIKPEVDAYFEADTALENFERLQENIWPLYREIEKKAEDNEALKEAARRIAEGSMGGGNSPGSGEPQSGGEPGEAGESFGKKLIRRVKRLFGVNDAPPKERGPSKDQLESDLSNADQRRIKDDVRAQEQQAKEDQPKTKTKQDSALPRDLDLTKMQPETIEALKKAVNSLTPEEKAELQKIARELLDRKQAEALKKDLPKGFDLQRDPNTGEYQAAPKQPPSGPDRRAADEELEQILSLSTAGEGQGSASGASPVEPRSDRAEQLKRELEELEMKKDGFEEIERELYVYYRQMEGEILPKIKNFIRMIEPYLPKDDRLSWDQGEHYIGKRLNLKRVHERVPTGDYRLYERRTPKPLDDPKLFVQLVIDNSGSMQGEKMHEALKTAIFWGAACSILDIPFAIKFFGDRTEDIMKFGDDFEKPGSRIKPNLVKHAGADGGWTDMSSPLQETKDALALARRRYPTSLGAVFVISDSGANRGLTGEPLKDLIRELQKSYIVQNFILTPNQQEVTQAKWYFGDEQVVAPAKFSDLPDHAFVALRRAFEKALRRSK